MSKVNLTKEQIKEIAGEMEMGFRCFYNPETGEEYQKEVVPIALSCAKCKKSLVYSPYNKD